MAGFEILFEATDQASPIIEKLSKQMLEAAQRSERFAGDIAVASRRVDESLGKIAPKASQAAGSMAALQSAGQQLQQQLLGFATVAGIAAFFKSSAEAAMQEEEALRRLSFAVQATGGSFDASKERILAFAQEQQALTRFSDTQTFEAMGRLVRVTGDVNQSMQATRLAFGLASASGRDLNTILDLLGPILNGDASRLRALKNEFGAFIGSADTAQEVLDVLSKRFVGAAEGEQGFTKEIAITRNALSDFQESVGGGVLPAFRFLLAVAAQGARAFELVGTAIANLAASALVHFEFIGKSAAALFLGQLSKLPGIVRESTNRLVSIQQDSAEQIFEIEKRYSRERVKTVQDEGRLKAAVTKKSREEADKEVREKEQNAQRAHQTVVRLEAERLDLEKNGVDSRRLLSELEKEDRFRQLDEMKAKGLLTEQEILQAKLSATEIARLKVEEAKADQLKHLDEIEQAAKRVSDSMASAVSTSVADMILEGKTFEAAMKSVFNAVLRTAIETYTRMAVEAAIAQSAAEGAAMGGGAGMGFAILGGMAMSKGFKFAEGGVVTKPTVGLVGEAGPEAIIPLDRVNGLGKTEVTVQQTNNFTLNGGASDEQVRTIMRQISDVTRSGAAEGAELVKSILSRGDKVSKQSV